MPAYRYGYKFPKKIIFAMLLLALIGGVVYYYHPQWLSRLTRPKDIIEQGKDETARHLFKIQDRTQQVLGKIEEFVSPEGSGAAKLQKTIEDRVEKVVKETVEETKTVIRTKAVIESVKSLPEDEQEIVREYICQPH